MTAKLPIVAGVGFVFVSINVLVAVLAILFVIPGNADPSPVDPPNWMIAIGIPLLWTILGCNAGLQLLRAARADDESARRYRTIGKWYIRLSLVAGPVSIFSGAKSVQAKSHLGSLNAPAIPSLALRADCGGTGP